MTTNLLSHISDDEFHPSTFDLTCHSISIGPVIATFCTNLNPPSVSVKLSVFGQDVANCNISNTHPTCKIGGSYHGAKAELDLTFNVPNKVINYTLNVCLPIIGCHTKNGSINL